MSGLENHTDRIMAAESATLPSGQEELLLAARKAAYELHCAFMQGDVLRAGFADERYQAVIWKLNGGTFIGAMSSDIAPGNLVERFCRAAPEEIPGWGQSGVFSIEVNQIRAQVKYKWLGQGRVHYEFTALDKGDFISETGFRSHFDSWMAGHTVEQAAAVIFQKYLALGVKPRMPKAFNVSGEVPPGYELVDVFLPAPKAFIVKKWAAAAEEKIAAKLRNLRQEGGIK